MPTQSEQPSEFFSEGCSAASRVIQDRQVSTSKYFAPHFVCHALFFQGLLSKRPGLHPNFKGMIEKARSPGFVNTIKFDEALLN